MDGVLALCLSLLRFVSLKTKQIARRQSASGIAAYDYARASHVTHTFLAKIHYYNMNADGYGRVVCVGNISTSLHVCLYLD